MILTYRYRVKGAGKALARMVRSVNLVWNYCGEAQEHARRWNTRWPSSFDLNNLTSGVSRELGLHSDTVQGVCRQFAISRNKIRRRPRWRGRKALGWVPFQAGRAIKISDGVAWFLGRKYRLWFSRPVGGKIKSGCFAQDACGRWYLNLHVEVETVECEASGEVGIDLGLATLATLSTGEKIENPRHIRRHEEALAKAQRAGNKRRAKAIHAKVANCRRHHLHEVTTDLVRRHRRIVVGNVSASKLAQTKMAKSVLDAGWSKLRGMLRYKAMMLGADYVEVDEQYSSKVCSACSACSGPRGLKDLGVRSWVCSDCGTLHDRDQNAALNLLASGRNVGLHQPEIRGL
jgi:IS605 OrfB family transposase